MARLTCLVSAVLAISLAAAVAHAAAEAQPMGEHKLQAPVQQKPAQQGPGVQTQAKPRQDAPQSRPTAQQAPQQRSSTAAVQQQPKSSIEDLNNLPCDRIRCSRDFDPVCATGTGVGGCQTPDKGCTYTNACLARCVYGVKITALGECTAKDAAKVVEDEPQPPAGGCSHCEWKSVPVCAKLPGCKKPGGCTYANECFAKCYGATDIRKGACQ